MIQLTKEQREELGNPVFDEMLDDDVRQMQPLLAALAPEDWEDVAAYETKA